VQGWVNWWHGHGDEQVGLNAWFQQCLKPV